MSSDERGWYLLNASPDLLAQIQQFEPLQPAAIAKPLERQPNELAAEAAKVGRPYEFDALRATSAVRASPIRGVLLTNADLDHTLGLALMREGGPLKLYSTPQVREALSFRLRLLPLLEEFCGVNWHESPFEELELGGLRVQAFSILSAPGKMRHDAYLFNLFRSQRLAYNDLMKICHDQAAVERRVIEFVRELGGRVSGHHLNTTDTHSRKSHAESIGYILTDARTGGRLVFAPDAAFVDDQLAERLEQADVVLFDGTFWSDLEMHRVKVFDPLRNAALMGHIPISGEHGSLATLAKLRAKHRVYIHINNTNPILLEDSPERKMLDDAGIVVGADGMEFEI